MTCDTQDIEILQGKTFSRIVRWQTPPLVYKPITAITQAGPVAITATGHGMPDGWFAAVVSAGGMRQINAAHWPLIDTDFHQASVTNANTITFNDTNSGSYTAYTTGGSLVYYTPVDLTSYTARMMIRATVDATAVLVSLVSGVASPLSGITLDNTLKTITLLISATDTAALTFLTGVYDLELVSPAGVVTQLLSGNVTVTDEVTR